MGHTGMQLLETYDLGTPSQETFTLINWGMPDSSTKHSKNGNQQWEQSNMSKSRPHNEDTRQSSKSLAQRATPSTNDHTQQKRYTALASYADHNRLPPAAAEDDYSTTYSSLQADPSSPPQEPDTTPFSSPFPQHKSWNNEKPMPSCSEYKHLTP